MEAHAGAGTPGVSLSAIQSYLRGSAEPSLRFIEEAARLLSVRSEWLAWGHGAPTDEEEAARRESPEDELARVRESMYRALGIPSQWPEAEAWAPTVRHAAIALHRHAGMWTLLFSDEPYTATVADALEVVTEAIAAPLRVLGLDPIRLTDREGYTQQVALAITGAIRQYDYIPNPGAIEAQTEEEES
jgi:transcriptional regulator with XRE-family HTH domain